MSLLNLASEAAHTTASTRKRMVNCEPDQMGDGENRKCTRKAIRMASSREERAEIKRGRKKRARLRRRDCPRIHTSARAPNECEGQIPQV